MFVRTAIQDIRQSLETAAAHDIYQDHLKEVLAKLEDLALYLQEGTAVENEEVLEILRCCISLLRTFITAFNSAVMVDLKPLNDSNAHAARVESSWLFPAGLVAGSTLTLVFVTSVGSWLGAFLSK